MMAEEKAGRKGGIYPWAVIAAGAGVWLAAAAALLLTGYGWREQLIVLALVPAVVVTGMFPTTFPLPSGHS